MGTTDTPDLDFDEFCRMIDVAKSFVANGDKESATELVAKIDSATNTGDWVWYWVSILDFGNLYEDGMVYLNNGIQLPLKTEHDLWDVMHNYPGAWRQVPINQFEQD